MASVSHDSDGNTRILFKAAGKKRQAIRLGKVNKKFAESIKLKVEALTSAASARIPLDTETAAWVAEIGDDLAAKLAAVGLIHERPKVVTLSGLLTRYAEEKEAENKPGTRTNHRTITNDLVGFFGGTTDPRSITPDNAKKFLDHLRERELAAATVSRRVRRTRSIFAHAVKKKLLPSNPFAEVRAMSVLPPERKAYVPVEDAERLLAAANPTLRTVIALARFAGLRCPSEVLMLKWSDVNFDTERITIPSCKTEHIPGKEYRVWPIFAALRPHLDDAFELAAPGEAYVVGGEQGDRHREKARGSEGWMSVNLRTAFEKVIRRAGLKPWPRLFNTMRASCEADLLEEFPISAVTEWLGHSATVALKHYARVPDALFERAANGGTNSGADSSGHETTGPDRIAGSA